MTALPAVLCHVVQGGVLRSALDSARDLGLTGVERRAAALLA